jgi:hypothetical protein
MNQKVIHDTLDELLQIAVAGSSPNISESEREALEEAYRQRCERLKPWIGQKKKAKRGTRGDFQYPI